MGDLRWRGFSQQITNVYRGNNRDRKSLPYYEYKNDYFK